MKHYVLGGLIVALAHLAAIPAMAADKKVEIINKTGFEMVEFYGSSKGSDSWEEDIFGDKTLPNGSSVTVNFEDGSGYCMFDLMAVFEDGEQVTAEDIDVCKLGSFTFE